MKRYDLAETISRRLYVHWISVYMNKMASAQNERVYEIVVVVVFVVVVISRRRRYR